MARPRRLNNCGRWRSITISTMMSSEFREQAGKLVPLVSDTGIAASDYRFRLRSICLLAAQCGVADMQSALKVITQGPPRRRWRTPVSAPDWKDVLPAPPPGGSLHEAWMTSFDQPDAGLLVEHLLPSLLGTSYTLTPEVHRCTLFFGELGTALEALRGRITVISSPPRGDPRGFAVPVAVALRGALHRRGGIARCAALQAVGVSLEGRG